MAGPILQQVFAARLGSSDSTAVRRGLAELLRTEWVRRPELRDLLLRAPLLHLLTDPDGESRCARSSAWRQSVTVHTLTCARCVATRVHPCAALQAPSGWMRSGGGVRCCPRSCLSACRRCSALQKHLQWSWCASKCLETHLLDLC